MIYCYFFSFEGIINQIINGIFCWSYLFTWTEGIGYSKYICFNTIDTMINFTVYFTNKPICTIDCCWITRCFLIDWQIVRSPYNYERTTKYKFTFELQILYCFKNTQG